MSDASEVKRFPVPENLLDASSWKYSDGSDVPVLMCISASDHDRIMAERDELWKRAAKFVMPGEIDTGESIEHYIKTLEQTIAELRSEVAQAKREAADAMSGCCDCPMFKAKGKTVARQAKVIEKLKAMVSHYETCATVDRYDDEIVPCDCGLDKELAAIEKEGAKDE